MIKLKRTLKTILVLLGFTAAVSAVLGSLGLQSAYANDSSDFHLTLVSSDVAHADVSDQITGQQLTTVNGATQLLWWYPNHHIKVSKGAVKNAPHIKSHYTECSKQSKSIARQAHGASVVVLKVGSTACNTGKNGNIVGGFKWTVKVPAVLKWSSKLHLYQHVYDLVGGKLVKTCGNHIGGHVDVVYNNVVQVRYAEDLQYVGSLAVNTHASVNATFHLTCPNGADFNIQASAGGDGTAGELVNFSERTRASVESAEKAKFSGQSQSSAQLNGNSNAQAKIDVSGTCGSNTPTYYPPSLSVTPRGCVDQGSQNGTLDFVVGNNDNDAHAVNVTVANHDQHVTVQVPAHGQASGSLYAFYGGSYTLTATVVDTGLFVSAGTQIVDCPQQQKPQGSYTNLDNPNDVLWGNSRTLTVQGMIPSGTSGTSVCAANIGSITSNKSVSLGAGSFSYQIVYKAPTEGSSDSITCSLFGADGSKNDTRTVSFALTHPVSDPS